jgi:hypothetical protein
MKVYGIKPVSKNVSGTDISVVTIGEEGRGRTIQHVPCPAKFEFLDTILPTEGTIKKKGKLIQSDSDKGWIARISTEGAYVRGAKGNVSVHSEYKDSIKLVAKASGAFGDAGRTGNWDDMIICTELEEFWLRVRPSRGSAYILLFREDKVTRLSYPDVELLDLDLAGSTQDSKGSGLVRL